MCDPAAVRRPAGRVLLVDSERRVLLLEHRTDLAAGHTVWAAPGGGCEPGESPARAAARELREECGISVELAEDASPLCRESRRWHFNGIAYDQDDHFYLVRVPGQPAVSAQSRTALEEITVLGFRWFSAEDLLRTSTRFEPECLPRLLEELP